MKSALLFLVQTGLAISGSTPESPEALMCHLSVRRGCSEDNICIDSMIRSTEQIRIDIKHLSFRSKRGSGKMVFYKDPMPDGRHIFKLISPPLGPTDVVFSPDFRMAHIIKGVGESEDYSCS